MNWLTAANGKRPEDSESGYPAYLPSLLLPVHAWCSKGIISLDGCPMGDPRLPFLPVALDDPKLVELYHDIRKAVEDTKDL